jgi:hypothetical protein
MKEKGNDKKDVELMIAGEEIESLKNQLKQIKISMADSEGAYQLKIKELKQ